MKKQSGIVGLLLALLFIVLSFGYEALTGESLDTLLDGAEPGLRATATVADARDGALFTGDGEAAILAAFEAQQSDLIVEGQGEVSRLLPDDLEGSRHQRFILELSSGHTLLIAHNIDLAPRVPLEEGDQVAFKGEYEWNEQGGVIHWTHHDPAGRHPDGWIRHKGEFYK